MTGNVIAALC